MSNSSDQSKKVKGVGKSRNVEATKAVDELDSVKGVTGISRVRGVGDVKAATQVTAANREKLLSLVEEETAKLAKSGMIPASQKNVVELAVKLAIEGSLLEEKVAEGTAGKGKGR